MTIRRFTTLLSMALCLAVRASAEASPSERVASEADSVTFRSWAKARALLDNAIAAHGGLENINAIRNLTVDYEGSRRMLNQSRKVDVVDREPSSGKLVVDRDHDRMYALSTNSYPGIGAFGSAWALTGNDGYQWEPFRNHHGSEIIAKIEGPAADGPWAFIPRWMPPLLLLAANENNTSLRWIDRFAREGRELEAISFVQRDRASLVVLFDAKTNLFEGFETIRDDGVLGDVTELVRYHDYATVAGVRFPAKRTEYVNGEVARELDLKFSANTTLDESLFKLPEGITMPAPAAEDTPRIRKIADGVYLDEGMGGMMIVEFDTFLLVVECPGNFWMSQSTIDAVTAAIPGKPIRYIVPSHTHGDHGGGARAYFHAGTTLITTPAHVEFYKRLATITQSIRPDPLSSSRREPIIEVFERKRVITEGEQTIELHDVGPTVHSEELTIAYLPKQRIVWQADLVFNPYTGGAINKAMPIGMEFARKLEALGLEQFELMVEAHHSRVITRAEFVRSLEMAGFTGLP